MGCPNLSVAQIPVPGKPTVKTVECKTGARELFCFHWKLLSMNALRGVVFCVLCSFAIAAPLELASHEEKHPQNHRTALAVIQDGDHCWGSVVFQQRSPADPVVIYASFNNVQVR